MISLDIIQGICFFLISISISEKDVPFAWTPLPPPVPFCPFLADPLHPPDLGRPFWMPPKDIEAKGQLYYVVACFEALCKGVLTASSDFSCNFFHILTSGFEQCAFTLCRTMF